MLDKGLIQVANERYVDEVSVIAPHFDIPKHVGVDYCGKTAVTPLVICLLGVVPYSYDKAVR